MSSAFNFSHGDHEEQLGRMTMVREAVKKTGKDVGLSFRY